MTDEEAQAAGFLSADDMAQYVEAMKEDAEVHDWIDAGAPSLRTLWLEGTGAREVDTIPLTVEQAARRQNVSAKFIRRRLPVLAEMDPPGARRIGTGARAPWRIVPAALDRLMEVGTVQPEPAKPPRGRKAPAPKKRSATRWEV